MKIAVIDQVGNFGGGSRFTRSLIIGLKERHPDALITYFGKYESMMREGAEAEFAKKGISTKAINGSIMQRFAYRLVYLISRRYPELQRFMPVILKKLSFRNLSRMIHDHVKSYDLVFFPWPFFLDFIKLDIPSVAVFHDFNFKYFFGFYSYGSKQLKELDSQFSLWMEQATPVVSTYFMKSELKKFYPEYASKCKVIHLAPFATDDMDIKEARNIIENRFNIDFQYIIYPANMSTHKNINTLLVAMSMLRKMGEKIILIITGPDTEGIKGKACSIGIERCDSGFNVLGLGYVSNKEIAALIMCAKIVISCSLYEAGNGPGMDAWSKGVPVAMSDIPAFREHVTVQGVRAEIFNPKNPEDIAKKIHKILRNYNKYKTDALYSKKMLQNVTWEKTADQYYKLFSEEIKKKSN
ncbi:MAG: glycosyltransferase [Spirochaetes bacterium]|nr:glycosyltransferase [Spirochaetota bacterium]